MRTENEKDFDLLIKETLADAEEKVPSRVWKGVSARIGAGTTAQSGALTSLWRWAAPSLAFAAAAVAAFFIVSGTNEKTIMNEGRLALDVKATACTFEPTLSAADVPSIKADFVPRETPSVAAATVAPEETVAAEESAKPYAEAKMTEAQPEEAEETFSDPFAQMEAEDKAAEKAAARKSAGKTSILVGGALGANDTHYDNSTFGPSFASGGSAASAVNESSVSNFNFPVSAGLGVKYHVTDRLAIGTGVDWTLLSRTFEGSYKTEEGLMTHKLQYIGIPVHCYWDFVDKSTLQIYAYGGGRAEKCIYNEYFIYEKSSSPLYKEDVNGLQYGLDLGFGVEFKLTDHFAIYLDPCMQYWFAGNQPKSIRTEKPILFTFNGGLRFNL